MPTTTGVVQRRTFRQAYRERGYFFREAAMLTIFIGFCMHLYRVIFGDDLALQYAVTPTSDRILLVPMTYAAVTGIMTWHCMRFANKPHEIAITAAIAYITASVPLHVYFSVWRGDVSFFVEFFPMWFSYLLLFPVYPAFLTVLWRVRYKN
jgi:multisubunit Na+/H+ antiporter MnhF subunit